jgi:hypothetical protein
MLLSVLFTIIIIIMISLLSFSMTNVIIISYPLIPAANIAFADHGQEVSITLNSTQFVPLTTGEGNRIQVFVDYTVNDPSIINQTINSVMKVYQVNGTLIKTSSSPNGFIVNSTDGIQRHATTISNNSELQNVIAVIQFTDLAKIIPMSNPVQVKLNLTQVSNATVVEKEKENQIAGFLLQ